MSYCPECAELLKLLESERAKVRAASFNAINVVDWKPRAEQRESELAEARSALQAMQQDINAWREVGEELVRVIQAMTPEQHLDLLPDWFHPRVSELLAAPAHPQE